MQLDAGKIYDLKVSRVFVRSEWGNPLEAHIGLRWVNESRNLVAEAVTLTDEADLVVFAGGISPRLEGEEMRVELDGFDYGDRTHINLPIEQHDLLEVLHALGKPVVMLNFSGSAMALNWENQNLDAIVQAFYPGEATGKAVAGLLFGEFSPSGKLPVTFYKGVDDLLGFKDYRMRNRTYKYYDGEVLYPFGHGLSYARFAYSDLNITNNDDHSLVVKATVANTSEIDAEQVTQVYVELLDAPDSAPRRELAGFKRAKLAAGESRTLEFYVTPRELSYIDKTGQEQRYFGRVLISVGAGQPGYEKGEDLVQQVFQI